MFSPFKVSNFQEKIVSFYKASQTMNAGALVDIDTSDPTAVQSSIGFSSLTGGNVKLASVGLSTSTAPAFNRPLGMTVVSVSQNGASLVTKILGLANQYMDVPVGAAVPIFNYGSGDIVSTTEFVGYVAGDSTATGYLDVTNVANYGVPMGAFNGRFRVAQATNAVIARYLGNTTVDGVLLPLFQFA